MLNLFEIEQLNTASGVSLLPEVSTSVAGEQRKRRGRHLTRASSLELTG